MKYKIVRLKNGWFCGEVKKDSYEKVVSIDYVKNPLNAMTHPIREVWYEEKQLLLVEDYLENNNIEYEVYILEYDIRPY